MTNYSLILKEMLQEAAQEIGYEYDDEVHDLMVMQINNSYGVDINRMKVSPASWQIMNLLSNEVKEWQEETSRNFV